MFVNFEDAFVNFFPFSLRPGLLTCLKELSNVYTIMFKQLCDFRKQVILTIESIYINLVFSLS